MIANACNVVYEVRLSALSSHGHISEYKLSIAQCRNDSRHVENWLGDRCFGRALRM